MLTHITYVGHATLLIEAAGVRLLTDPLLRDGLVHLRRHAVQVDAEWYQDLDAVLISHMHWDHLDLPSLQLLDPTTHFITPHGAARILRRHGFSNVSEVDVGDTIELGSVAIRATYAEHDSRIPLLQSEASALGYLIASEHTIYFAGDTDLFADMSSLHPDLDVALVPVWGWGPTVSSGHLDPYRAAESVRRLRPRMAIPIHWGTFLPLGLRRLLPELLTDPPHTFARRAAEVAPAVHVCVLQPGTRISLDETLNDD